MGTTVIGNELAESGLRSVREIIDEIGIELFLDPRRMAKASRTPFFEFDELTNGLREGEFIVLAGRPAMGKTAMALNFASLVALLRGDEPGKAVAVFSLGVSREVLLRRVLFGEARVDQRRFLNGHLNRNENLRADDGPRRQKRPE